MTERFGPRTIEPDLVKDLWRDAVMMRDKMFNLEIQARAGKEKLDKLLERMRAAGFADWIPTLEEVQKAWQES